MDTLIVATPVDTGYYLELRGVHNGLRVVQPPPVSHMEDLDQPGILRSAKIFACAKQDMLAVVEEISKYNVGIDIKVYDLTNQFTRLPGELKSLTVTKDGKLPF